MQDLNTIFDKYIKGECTVEQLKLLLDHFNEIDNNSSVGTRIEDIISAEAPSHKDTPEVEAILATNHQNIMKSIQERRRKIQLYFQLAAACLIFGTGFIFYLITRKQNSTLKSTEQVQIFNIAPGGNKAFLTLSNGKRLSLTDAVNGTVTKDAGIEISKTSKGEIIYTITDRINHSNALNALSALNVLNALETPKGGQYQVRLPDGSRVWLNAASKLIYPVSFKGQATRKVELSGEAYFEVAKDKQHPFHVKTIGQDVEVLGTHFNINTYTDEPETVTTLLEGSVHVAGNNRFNHSGDGAILKPGEQAIQTKTGKFIVSAANVNVALAWKDGKFWFKEAKLETILRQFSRWYNVDIRYENGIPDEKFSGGLDKNLSLADALEILKFTKVNFKIEGRTIIVMK